MTVPGDHDQILDQLQLEVNRVIEQTGRFFAAFNASNKSAALAQMTRLKKVVPDSAGRFHDALDLLEDEIQLAKAVLRRDLAVCRERSGQRPESQPTTQPLKASTDHDQIHNGNSAMPSITPATGSDSKDPMTKLPPVESNNIDNTLNETPSVVQDQKHNAVADSPKHWPTAEAPEHVSQDQQPADSKLQLDTTTANQPHQNDEEKPPSTAFSTNADMDSLFGTAETRRGSGEDNAPTTGANSNSNGPSGNDDYEIDYSETADNPDTSNNIDFASFNATLDANGGGAGDNNDHLSTLLPGLEDYANTQPSANGEEPDYNAFFASATATGDGDGAQSQEGQQGEAEGGETRDTTFDDFMNFNFDSRDGDGDQEMTFDFS